MRSLPLISVAAWVLGASVVASQAQAAESTYGQGDFFTRVGVARVSPKSDNGNYDALSVNKVDVQDDRGLAFTFGYRFLDKWGVELLAAERFEHDFELDGAESGSVKHLPPTLTLQYYPLGGTDARVQPYVGAGINYTRFSSENLNIDGASMDMDDSWGWAGQVGVDLLIGDHWALNAAAWYLDIDADTTVDLAGHSYDTELHIDPIVVMGGISYRF